MTDRLRSVLVHRPDAAFGAAFDNPAHGFRHPVDLATAQAEHDAYTDLLASLGVWVHRLVAYTDDPDLVYTFDPALVTAGRRDPPPPGKPNRPASRGSSGSGSRTRGIPIAGRIGPRATIEGGDVFWLRPDLVVHRPFPPHQRRRRRAARRAHPRRGPVFDLPYWRGPDELVHLLSVISPVTPDLAVVYPPLLPIGLWTLLKELRIATIAVPDEEYETLGCNVLVVRPGVVIMAEGNPVTRRALESAGCEVHTYPATEIGLNGSGGPPACRLPLLRALTGPCSSLPSALANG